jgi:TonB family protein
MKKFIPFRRLLRLAALFLLLFAAAGNLMAQRWKTESERRYEDRLEPGEKFLQSDHQNLYVSHADGHFIHKIFYPETGQITHRMTFGDRRFSVLNGPYQEWYDNGRLWMEGAYRGGLQHGPWSYYNHEHGGKTYSGSFVQGEKEGKWLRYDSLGRITHEENYVGGQQHGKQFVFDSTGIVELTRYYEKGEQLSSEPEEVRDSSEIMPYMLQCKDNPDLELRKACSDQVMMSSIYREVKYPAFARRNNIQGRVILSFVIEKDGSISQIKTLRGVSADIEAECLRVLALMPRWAPGMKGGQPVRVRFQLPIMFKLD